MPSRSAEAELRKHVEILASDEYEGRGPGTEGERKTLAYLENEWTKAGLQTRRTRRQLVSAG
jgi:hypothetical protein